MSVRPPKRKRASTNGGASPPTAVFDYRRTTKRVDLLDDNTIKRLLITAAEMYSAFDRLIQIECKEKVAEELKRVRDFDWLSKDAWKTLNVTYAKIRDSHAYELSGEAYGSIESSFDIIRRDCPSSASSKTKENALETLRKIGKSICLSDGTIAYEVRKSGWTYDLSYTMKPIVKSLTDPEKRKLQPWYDNKLVELSRLAEGYDKLQ